MQRNMLNGYYLGIKMSSLNPILYMNTHYKVEKVTHQTIENAREAILAPRRTGQATQVLSYPESKTSGDADNHATGCRLHPGSGQGSC